MKNFSTSLINYKNLMQYRIKQGKKTLIENTFKKGLLFWMKTKSVNPVSIENVNKNKPITFNNVLNQALHNVTPFVNIKTKRKGSKNIYIPVRLTLRHSKFLAAKWILTTADIKSTSKFYENLINELKESAVNKSLSVKKYIELYKVVEENLIYKKKKKYLRVNKIIKSI